MPVTILSGVTSKFGELWDVSPRNLVKEVALAAADEAGFALDKIEAVFVGNMLSSSLGGQDHLGAFFSEELGLSVPAVKIEAACASGGMAAHLAYLAIKSGQYKNVLVVGVEKMTDHKPEAVAAALMGAGSEGEREAGATFPALYALIARAHMLKYGTTEAAMAEVSVKNHFHASLNSHAQFTNRITRQMVMESPVVASPLKILDCSPITDGAAALILSSKPLKKGIIISASQAATDSLGLAQRLDLTTLKAAVSASNKAYQEAGVKPEDIKVAEVHDCFSIAEIIAMEDLGFFPKGEAASAIEKGKTQLGNNRLVVNTSGGLKAAGHPVGATGVKQLVEVYQQLKGISGKKQVPGADLGLTHNIGGSGATAVIHILKK
ncbi:MAG: acetyl-CoA acetyltransferase, acetyl-CoA C-acetyltransferase [Candidatus Gottesmanbacteria bacterium GW2011_GWA2_43_14]|uniref:Acetyl-CoA acetyltransferase, acetyl-CoA C-acetyltransferase n=1 Tax=Candidatus Gottesmanbacteria bacterium GW2011_GWA2_43_14 TaxID=1618443 RepID=A0A0G1DJX0_9BACT|nr:MAG: acetyl-CoA acetyltransferase, acetyl-CoA C-acetyltransferase [Candidatus Gottesmanbacteria bacterium GW2011_GWA2_43_14]